MRQHIKKLKQNNNNSNNKQNINSRQNVLYEQNISMKERIKNLQQISKYADILLSHNQQYQQIVTIHQNQIRTLKCMLQQRDRQFQKLILEQQQTITNMYASNTQQVLKLSMNIKQMKIYIDQLTKATDKTKYQYQQQINTQKQQIIVLQKTIHKFKQQMKNIYVKEQFKREQYQQQLKINFKKQLDLISKQLQIALQANAQIKTKYQITVEKLHENQTKATEYQFELKIVVNELNKLQNLSTINKKLIEQNKQYQLILKDKDNQIIELQSKRTKFQSQQKSNYEKIIKQNEKLQQLLQQKLQLEQIVINLQAVVKQDQIQMKKIITDCQIDRNQYQQNLSKIKDKYEKLLKQQQIMYTKKIKINEKQKRLPLNKYQNL